MPQPKRLVTTRTKQRNIARSIEELLRYQGEEFIEFAYQTLLGRSPDAEGLRHYKKRLIAGVSKIEILDQIRNGKEGAKKKINLPNLDKQLGRYRLAKMPVVGLGFKLFFEIVVFYGRYKNKNQGHNQYTGFETVDFLKFEKKNEMVVKSKKDISIAVVIPFYNGSKYVERAIKSAVNQTYPAKEIVVVDDGSSDDESEVCSKIANKYKVIYVKKRNGGQGDARNFGVQITTSEYICCLDQDDFYLPRHNEILAEYVTDDPMFGFIYADLHRTDIDGNVVQMSLMNENQHHPKTNLVDCLAQDMFVLPSASLISRVAFEAVGGFDPRLTGYEDDDLFLRLFRKGYSNTYLTEPVTAWCINEGSTSFSVRMGRSRLIYFTKLISTFDNVEISFFKGYITDLIVPRFIRQFVGDALSNIINETNHVEEYKEIFATALALSRPYLSAEELELLDTIAIVMNSPRKTLINILYFGRLAEPYGFDQAYYWENGM